MVSRLADQKGVDLLLPLTPFLEHLGATLIVLGDGDQGLAEALSAAASAHGAQVAFVRGYDEALAHQLFAGGDVFVMPSRFEPCGLAQMQSMRYGTLPLVTDVGGLHDTVVDVDAAPTRGTGVVVPYPSAVALMDGLHRVVKAYSQPRRRTAMQKRGMLIDWSWKRPAAAHIDWYERLVAEKV
jgi:starch synthase